jgi:Phosphotransferase enzyme family
MLTTYPDADWLIEQVRGQLITLGLESEITGFESIRKDAQTQDSSAAYFVSTRTSRSVLLVSPGTFPGVVQSDVDKAAQFKHALGPHGYPVIEPIYSGMGQGVSYALLPFHNPLSRHRLLKRWHVSRVTPPVLRWLRDITLHAQTDAEGEIYRRNLAALRSLTSLGSAAEALLGAAETALPMPDFRPVHVPMHGDLWLGNILRGDQSRRFTIIDWGGSSLVGFPLFDLLRFAVSSGLSRTRLRGEIERHQSILACRREHLPAYLAVALGHYALCRGEFPLERLRDMTERVAAAFQTAA